MQNDEHTDRHGSREAERHVAAVTAALSILDCFVEDTSLRLRDLHERTGMQKSRILRLAGSLIAMLTLMKDAESEVSPVFPYIETDEEMLERKANMDHRRATLDPVAIEEKLRKAREAHIAKRGGMSV